MADLKFGNATPSVGDIKVGSNDVSRIYQGTTEVWPGCSPITPAETEINGLVWQNKNSVITARTNGGTIPIVTSTSAWNSAYNAGTPAAAYWNFNSSNSEIGLYYNIYCLNTIQPPTGFRVPTINDALNIANATTGTEISNNDCGFWPSEINSNPNLNTINWNSNGRGYVYVDYFTDEVKFYNDFGRNPMSVYWYLPQPTGVGRTAGFATRYRDDLGPYIQNGLPQSQSAGTRKDKGYHIRFVKDVSVLELYDNDTQTAPTVSSIVESRLSPVGQTGQYQDVAVDVGSVVVPSGGGDLTFFQYLSDSTMPNITDGYFTEGRIRVYSNSSRAGTPVAEVHWTQANQGGTWSPDGTANQKEATVSLPQGTYYLRLAYFAEKGFPPGPAYQVIFNTGVSV